MHAQTHLSVRLGATQQRRLAPIMAPPIQAVAVRAAAVPLAIVASGTGLDKQAPGADRSTGGADAAELPVSIPLPSLPPTPPAPSPRLTAVPRWLCGPGSQAILTCPGGWFWRVLSSVNSAVAAAGLLCGLGPSSATLSNSDSASHWITTCVVRLRTTIVAWMTCWGHTQHEHFTAKPQPTNLVVVHRAR
jgi:hypothetical protein